MAIMDMTGRRFGRLTAIQPTTKRNHRGDVYWLCKCDCGNEKIINGHNLRRGFTRSCGCIVKEMAVSKARKMGLSSRKHFGCIYCGSDKHYAKGCCVSCYGKLKRGTLE